MKSQANPLVAAALSAGLLLPPIHAAVAPYSGTEANTVFLFHLDESEGSAAANAASGASASPLQALTIDGNPLTAGAAVNTEFLWGSPAFPGFGTAVDLSGGDDLAIAVDVTGLSSVPDGTFVASGSPDADNHTEYRLGLVPNSGRSRFAAVHTAGGTIEWPSQPGTSFKIERSINLSTWTELLPAPVTGAGSTTTYTDPAPPAGKAFYKVTLNP